MVGFLFKTFIVFLVGCACGAAINTLRSEGLRWDGAGIQALDLEREAARPIAEVKGIDDVTEVLAAFDNGAVIFVDARDAEAFARSHVVGAILIPAGELGPSLAARAFEHLPPGLPIVVYGQSAKCPAGSRVCKFLKEAGFKELGLFEPGWSVLDQSGIPRSAGGWQP